MIMTKLNKLIQPVLSTLPSGREGGRWLPRLVSAGWLNVLLLFTLLALWAAGIYSLFRWAPGWEYQLLFALMLFIVLMLWRPVAELWEPDKPAEEEEVMPDAASVDEQQAALSHLASLPHMQALSNGDVIDLLNGSTLTPCRCGKYSPLHLIVRYGNRRQSRLALISRGALSRYLSVQDAVATVVRQAARLPGGAA